MRVTCHFNLILLDVHSEVQVLLMYNVGRFEVFMAVRRMMMFFWVLAPCRLTGRSRRVYTAPEPTTSPMLEDFPV
jgi:hypothetical protein